MTAIKEKRITCAACGDRVTIIRGERGDPSTYCDVCREDVRREQARLRMQAMRERRGDA